MQREPLLRRPRASSRRSAGRLAGSFVDRSYTNAAGTLEYKVYLPAPSDVRPAGAARPLVVMLHGCSQTPEDFATGTRMNALADMHDFVVVYPAQSISANGSRCWNWFRAENQRRGEGEPSLIAGITEEVRDLFNIDAGKIFVAGMSAGASMAIILGATYPDLFTAVGAHSGVPFGAARSAFSAFSAMAGAGPSNWVSNLWGAPGVVSVPTIVFHGDADATVNHQNASVIVENVIAYLADGQPLCEAVQGGLESGGAYTQIVVDNASRQRMVEHWVLHGHGHDWSGGSDAGSHAVPNGPDASAQMVRFFRSVAADKSTLVELRLRS